MFENGVKEFELNDKVYPYKCSLLVLEKIQNEVGDIVEAEDKIRGFVPSVDADGIIDRSSGKFTIPSVGYVCRLLLWMLEEGKDITGSDIELPTETDLKRQDEYSINALALIVFREFGECVAGKKQKKKRATKK